MSPAPEQTLPRGWDRAAMGDVADFVMGQAPPGEECNKEGTGTIFVKAGEFGKPYPIVREWTTRPLKMARKGDVLICVVGATSGKLNLSIDCAIGRSVAAIRPADGINTKFLFHQLHLWVQSLRSGSRGSAQGVISQDDLASVQLLVAPSGVQGRTVETIESYYTRLNDAEATLERVKRNLERCRASVLRAAVEGRLVPTEVELARRERRPAPAVASVLSRIAPPPRPSRYTARTQDIIKGHASLAVGNPGTPLPEGWAWAPLVDVARLESGHTPSRRHPEWWNGEIPWIGIKDAREHHGQVIHDTFQHTNNQGLENSAARLLPTGTVCLSRTASVGYVVVTGKPMATSQDFVNWIPTAAVCSDWLRILFLADRDALLNFGKGTVHTTIYFPEVVSFHIGIPPLAEQQRIVATVDEVLSRADFVSRAIAMIAGKIVRMRQSVLATAFTGDLVPQDPAAEPASVLLDRIRTRRAKAAAFLETPRRRGRPRKAVKK